MLTVWQYPLLFATGLAAGFVDSIAGGGGLITLPVLLGLGGDPRSILGTNKLQASFGSGSAAWHYAQAKVVSFADCWRTFLFSAFGAAAGTLVIRLLNPDLLRRGLPVLLLAVAIYVWLKPQLGEVDLHPRLSRGWFDLIFGLSLGFYDGFFGPGAGTFWTMAFVLGQGFNLTRATAYTKVVNFASNLSSLAFFLSRGEVYFGAGLLMGVGQVLGARLGSGVVIKRGTKFIRPIFIVVVLAVTLKVLYDVNRR